MEIIIQELLTHISKALAFLQPAMLGIIGSLMVLDLVLHYLFNQEDIFLTLVKKVLIYGFFLWLIQDYDNVVLQKFLNGCIEIGNRTVGINSIKLMVSPLYFFLRTLSLTAPAFAIGTTGAVALDTLLGLESIPIALMFLLVGMFLSALLLSYEIGMMLVEFYAVAVYAIVLLPFGVFKKTRFLAEKALGAIFGQGIKIMIMTSLLNFFDKAWKEYIETALNAFSILSWKEMTLSIFVMIFLWGTIKRVPAIVHALLSGSASTGNSTSAFLGGIAGASFSSGINIMKSSYNQAGGIKGMYSTLRNNASSGYDNATKDLK